MDKLKSEDQLTKFIDTFNILTYNDILRRDTNFSSMIFLHGCLAGEFKGRVIERFKTAGITLDTLHMILHEVQNESAIGGDSSAVQRTRGFLARCTEYIDTAFDTAIHNKEKPSYLGDSNQKRYRL